MDKRNILRPIYGTICFQPFAFLWCLWSGADYFSMIGPFTIYSTVIFMPIYAYYEPWADKMGW